MALVAACSSKGAPGVTTLAVALASGWPGGQAILVEADPGGGDLAARFDFPDNPSLDPNSGNGCTAGDRIQSWPRLAFGPTVVPAPALPSAARDAVRRAVACGAIVDWAEHIPVIADVGRLDPVSPALRLA